MLGAPENHREAVGVVFRGTYDLQQPVGIVLWIGAPEADEDTLNLLLDRDGFVEHEGLAAYVVTLADKDVWQVGVVVQGIKYKVRLGAALAVVFEIDYPGIGDHRAQAYHVVYRSGQDVVYEDCVLLAAADLE